MRVPIIAGLSMALWMSACSSGTSPPQDGAPDHSGDGDDPSSPTEDPDDPAAPMDDDEPAAPMDDDEPDDPSASTVVVNRQNLAWSDQIQGSHQNYGWDGLGIEGSGALSKVDNPAGEGQAIEHRLDFPDFGRAQLGLWAQQEVLQHPDGVWIAQKIYFPEEVHATSGWLSIADHHAVNDAERWHAQPGIMLYSGANPPDRMKLWDSWHGSGVGDVSHNLSDAPLPVGEVFWLEYHYLWTTEPRAIPVYLNGNRIWETTAHPTRSASHVQAEHYVKWYGQGDWTPSSARRYTLEVLMSNVGQIVTLE